MPRSNEDAYIVDAPPWWFKDDGLGIFEKPNRNGFNYFPNGSNRYFTNPRYDNERVYDSEKVGPGTTPNYYPPPWLDSEMQRPLNDPNRSREEMYLGYDYGGFFEAAHGTTEQLKQAMADVPIADLIQMYTVVGQTGPEEIQRVLQSNPDDFKTEEDLRNYLIENIGSWYTQAPWADVGRQEQM